MKPPVLHRIEEFSGDYRFLSNFFPVVVTYDGYRYPSVEHAYQAAKCKFPEERKQFQCGIFLGESISAAKAKALGKRVTIRDNWHLPRVRLDVMHSLLRQKFLERPLKTKLLKTGDAELIEGNWWGDTFWGVCHGQGENMLGKLLMQVRKEMAEISSVDVALMREG